MSSLILIAVLVVLVLGLAYALTTVRGSGINLHPYRSDEAPGAEGPAEPTGVDQGEGSATSGGPDERTDPQHGTN